MFRKRRQGATTAGPTQLRRALRIRRERDERPGKRLHLGNRHEVAGLAVDDELAEPADLRRDHRPRPLHRLERDEPETLPQRRHDDAGGLLDRALNRGDEAEEAHRVVEAELTDERAQRGPEHAPACDLDAEVRHLLARFRQRAQEDDVALDRDQPADAEHVLPVALVRRRLGPLADPVVDDLE